MGTSGNRLYPSVFMINRGLQKSAFLTTKQSIPGFQAGNDDPGDRNKQCIWASGDYDRYQLYRR